MQARRAAGIHRVRAVLPCAVFVSGIGQVHHLREAARYAGFRTAHDAKLLPRKQGRKIGSDDDD